MIRFYDAYVFTNIQEYFLINIVSVFCKTYCLLMNVMSNKRWNDLKDTI